MPKAFTTLEKNILKSKGVTAAHLKKLKAAGVNAREDFATVGDAKTLHQLTGMPAKAADQVMEWALSGGGGDKPSAKPSQVRVDGADVVHCVHCGAKQPKDYKSGHLCTNCGKQAEPVLTCYWCAASGPGKFCRNCGAALVPTGELELAILLKRDGLPKDDIPKKLESLTPAEKDALWGRVRRTGHWSA
ncbi:MAG TPA: hypothetical protein VIG99_14885 [Myxococcaceae bacterium]|jgi:hypothetical protein